MTETQEKQHSNMMPLSEIYELVHDDFQATNALVLKYLNADVELIQKIGHHIIDSGGKRLRPLLVILSSKSLGYTGTAHIHLSVIIECIHTVTLLHDDVVDDSELRRGAKTANFIWGNEASILVGDFLYSRAFQLMTELNSMRIMKIFADTCNAVAMGEVIQLMHRNDPNTNEITYLVISMQCEIGQCK